MEKFRHSRTQKKKKKSDKITQTGLVAGRNGERLAPEGMPWRAPPQPAAGCSDPARLPGVRRHVLAGAAFPGPSEPRGSKASLSAGVEGRPRTWVLHGAGSAGPKRPRYPHPYGRPGGGGSLASSASQEGGRKPLSVCFQNVHLSCLHC